jgi:hypothetical protein
VKNSDVDRNEIVIRDGKGQKDRVTTLPNRFKEPLREHLVKVRELDERDLRQGARRVAMPEALERKYQNADREWGWQWVFPASSRSVDRETGEERRQSPTDEARQLPYAAARFSDASLRGRVRYPHDPGTAGAQRFRTTMAYTPVLNRGGRGVDQGQDEPHFFTAQNNWQLKFTRRPHEAKRRPIVLQRLFIEKLDPAQSDRRAGPRPLLLIGQVKEVLPELFFRNLVRTPMVMFGKLAHRAGVSFLSSCGVSPQLHILDHSST